MRIGPAICILPLLALALCFAGTANAGSYSKAVQKACGADYHKYCGEYGLESAALRVCMDKAGTQPIQGLRQCPGPGGRGHHRPKSIAARPRAASRR